MGGKGKDPPSSISVTCGNAVLPGQVCTQKSWTQLLMDWTSGELMQKALVLPKPQVLALGVVSTGRPRAALNSGGKGRWVVGSCPLLRLGDRVSRRKRRKEEMVFTEHGGEESLERTGVLLNGL